jgi:hypothetical protein
MGMLGSVAGAVRRGARNAFRGSPALGAADSVLATAGGGVAGGLAGGASMGEDGVGVGALGGMALGAPALGLRRLVMKIASELKAMHPEADNAQVLAAAQKKAAEMMGQR